MYINNSLWMIFEQFVRVVIGFVVGVYVARYLGVQGFGVLSYALSLVVIFSSFSKLGLESILIKELIAAPGVRNKNISVSIVMMLAASVASIVVIVGGVYSFETDPAVVWMTLAVAMGLIFQPGFVIDYAFQSELNARHSSSAKIFSMLLSAVFKVYLVHIDAGLIWIAVSYAVDTALLTVMLLVAYFRFEKNKFKFDFDSAAALNLLRASYPMIVSGVAAMLMARTDQIMIKHMLGVEELGVYAASGRIYEGWIAFYYVASMSILPLMGRLQNGGGSYERKIMLVFGLFFWGAILLSLFVFVLRHLIIDVAFGPSFAKSADVLGVMAVSTPFAALGFLSARFLIVEGLAKKVASRNWFAVAINFGINLFSIPHFGVMGAAYSTLISLFFANYVLDYLDRELRPLLRVKNKAILGVFNVRAGK